MTKTIAAALLVLGACGSDEPDTASIYGTWQFATDGNCGERADEVWIRDRALFGGEGLALFWLPETGGPGIDYDGGNEVDFSLYRLNEDLGDTEYLTVEIDTEAGTCVVVEARR